MSDLMTTRCQHCGESFFAVQPPKVELEPEPEDTHPLLRRGYSIPLKPSYYCPNCELMVTP